MPKQTVSRTALGAAICRLIEQYQPAQTRLFDDPIVKELVGAPVRLLMQLAAMRNYTVKQTDAVARGIFGVQICRTRYIDEALQAALAQDLAQVVILGAGLDTRPYRLTGMQAIRVFELDLPAAQNEKKRRLESHFGRLPENSIFIPLDFDTQTLGEVLAGTAFDPAKPTIFLWEGVTQYLSEQAVQQTLAYVGKSAPGSLLVFTYVLKSIIERRSDIPDANTMLDTVAKSAPWIFGLEPAGLDDSEPLSACPGCRCRWRRLPGEIPAPARSHLDVFAGERIAQARVI